MERTISLHDKITFGKYKDIIPYQLILYYGLISPNNRFVQYLNWGMSEGFLKIDKQLEEFIKQKKAEYTEWLLATYTID